MNIKLRETLKSDLDFVIELENREENAKFIGNWSLSEHKKSLDNRDVKHIIIEDSESTARIGYIILCGLKSKNRALEFMRILSSAKEYAFDNNKYNRLWLDVRTDNPRAKHLYESCGFKVEGELRESVFADNKFHSLFLLSILKREHKLFQE